MKKAQRKQKVVETQKTEIVATKCQNNRKKINLFSQENENNNDKSNINLNQENDLNPVFL